MAQEEKECVVCSGEKQIFNEETRQYENCRNCNGKGVIFVTVRVKEIKEK